MNRHERRQWLKSIEKLTTSATPEIEHQLYIAHQHQMAGNNSAAEPIYQEVLKLQPNHTDALLLYAMIKHDKGDKEGSLACINKAIKLSQHNALYHHHKGVILQNSWELEEAAAAFKQAVMLQPDFIEAHLGLGVAYTHMNATDKAIATFEHIVSLDPDHLAACNNLAMLYRDIGHIEEAIGLYRHALALKPDPVMHSNLLIALHYDPTQTREQLWEAHQEWNRL